MKSSLRTVIVLVVSITTWAAAKTAAAQGATASDEDQAPGAWTNVADVGAVFTAGNASTETFHFDNKLRGTWTVWSIDVRFGGLRSQIAPESFAVGSEDDFDVREPEQVVDAERYYVRGDVSRKIREYFFLQTGASWDRDRSAGIDRRTIVHAGVGNTWWDRDDLELRTDYSLASDLLTCHASEMSG